MSDVRTVDVSHSYDRRVVLRSVSLAVEAGEIACLLGPSGCGKTTLLRLIAGLEPLNRGRILIGGHLAAEGGGFELPPEQRNVGLMFQDYALFPHLTVAENITFGLRGRNSDRRSWVRNSLARLGLDGHERSYPHMLSGGEQQRVALLRALAPAPRVLLLDEPFSGLDTALRAHIREETRAFVKATGISTLMVTHDPEEAMSMGDRMLVMRNGVLVQAGTPQEIYDRPASEYVASLFGAINRLKGRVEGDRIKTALGTFDANGFQNGAIVDVLVRPEGLILLRGDAIGSTAVVTHVNIARRLGQTTDLRLSADDGSGTEVVLMARVPSSFASFPGDPVGIRIDDRHAFVFPA